jgi:hypothetical protein
MRTTFLPENLKERAHSEDLGTDRRIILELFLGKGGWEGVDWIHLTLDRDQWWALVNTVMNLRVAYKSANFLTS